MNTKIWIGDKNNRNIFQISTEDAAVKLRNKVTGHGSALKPIFNLVWLGWLVARLVIKCALLLVFVSIVFYDGFGSMDLAVYSFIIGSGILFMWACYDVVIRFNLLNLASERLFDRKDYRIPIGRSFKHYRNYGRPYGPDEVGSDSEHYIDYIGQPNPHVLINGSTSSGKTATLRTFVSRASLINGLNFLMIDWNGEGEEWASSIGATVWKVPQNFKISLFKLNGLSKEDRAGLAIQSLQVAAKLTELQATRVRSELLKFYRAGEEPSLYDMWSALCSGSASKVNGILDQRFRRIQRVIGSEPAEFWDHIFDRNNIISLAGLNESEKTLMIYALMQRIKELFDRKPELSNNLRLMVIIDEAWEFFEQEKEFDRYRKSSLEEIVRLGRKYGFGLVVSTQQVDDVPKVFINSCALIMLHQQRSSTYYGEDILDLDSYELACLKSANQGEMLLLDRKHAQTGKMWNDYVKVSQLSEHEVTALASKYGSFTPDAITEPQMPIEVHDSAQANVEPQRQHKDSTFKGVDIPSISIYRFMLAVAESGNRTKAYKTLKERRWITSSTTLYGNRSSPSILSRAVSFGYANQDGGLTEKGLNVIDSELIISKQGMYSGSEEHKELMRKTIKFIQGRGNFAFTLADKDSFDIGELKPKNKAVWDYKGLTIYECQTNAIKEELDKAIAKAKKFSAKLVFVVASNELAEQIKAETEGKYEAVVV